MHRSFYFDKQIKIHVFSDNSRILSIEFIYFIYQNIIYGFNLNYDSWNLEHTVSEISKANGDTIKNI